MNESPSKRLSSGSLLARNTVWNLVGQGAPLLVAIVAIPILIKGLGIDRFGVLTLAWMVIGYFGLFDLGLGRALTKSVAEKLGEEREQEIPAIVWTTLFIMLIFGLLGMLVVSLLSPWLVHDVLKIPVSIQNETLHAFYLLALSIPIVISTAGLRGYLEAYQRFDLVNIIRIPMGIFTFLGPLMVLQYSSDLLAVVAILAAGRLVAWIIHILLCFKITPALHHSIAIQRAAIKPLFRFGSWITITNIIGPLIVYLDRFLIGGLLSVAAVAYYVTPFEMATKLWIIPTAMTAVLFPAFATSWKQDSSRTALLFGRGVTYTFLAMFPITLLIVALAHEGIDLWLSAEFAQNSTLVFQWLAIGVFINSLAHTPFVLIQGIGRPDLTAKLHLIELPFYLPTLWWAISAHGIEGAAIVWVLRLTVDMTVLFWMALRFVPLRGTLLWRMGLALGAALFLLIVAAMSMSLEIKGIFLLASLLAYAFATWFLILSSNEKRVVLAPLFRLIKRKA